MNDLAQRSAAIDWYHGGIDLGDGVITAGMSDPAANLLPFLDLPDDLTGKSVIDICTWDGFMAFECERRGANPVVAIDSFAWDKRNSTLTKHSTGKDGFNLARWAKHSTVMAYDCDVLDLDAKKLGTYDIVLFLGVLYHMRHPLLALERIAPLVGDLLIVESHTDMNSSDWPAMRFYRGAEVNSDLTTWWGPNAMCIEGMLRDVGFADVRILPGAYGRVVVHARRAQ